MEIDVIQRLNRLISQGQIIHNKIEILFNMSINSIKHKFIFIFSSFNFYYINNLEQLFINSIYG